MTSTTPNPHPEPGRTETSADELVTGIEPARDELGDTVTASSGKRGRKARAAEAASRAQDSATDEQDKPRKNVLSGTAVVAAVVVAVIIIAIVRHRQAAAETPVARAIRLLEEVQRRQRNATATPLPGTKRNRKR